MTESEEFVTLAKPYEGEKIVTCLTELGAIRFVEGKARVPLSIAKKLAEPPGWLIEPRPVLQREKG